MTKMELEKLTEAGLIEELAALRKEVAKLKSLPARTEQEKDDLRPFFDQSLDLLCIAGFDGYFVSGCRYQVSPRYRPVV
jgi:hypothetical protein